MRVTTLGTSSPLATAFVIHEVADGARLHIGGLAAEAVAVHHDAPCFGVRLDDGRSTAAFTGDTGPCGGAERLAAQADLLIVEAGYGLGPADPEGVHLTATQAGELAAASGAKRLLLTHLAGADPETCAAQARSAGAQDVIPARPGLVVEL